MSHRFDHICHPRAGRAIRGLVLAAAVAVGSGLHAGPAIAKGSTAQTLATINGPEMQSLLQDWGYKAELTETNAGNPMINSSIEGLNYSIFFYGCDSQDVCGSIQYSTWFTLNNPVPADTVNDWNRTKRFGKAWLDQDGRAYLQMDINVAGGVSRDNLHEWLDWWGIGVSEFATFIGYR